MKRYIRNNKVKFRNEIVICQNGVQVINPTEEMILTDGWHEFVAPEAEPYKPTYEERVEQLIRERYSLNEELAIQRQRDTKVDEFNAYYEYCEDCKTKAKEEQL